MATVPQIVRRLGWPVGKRLVEALRTLRLLPTSGLRGKVAGLFHGWEDLLAQQEMKRPARAAEAHAESDTIVAHPQSRSRTMKPRLGGRDDSGGCCVSSKPPRCGRRTATISIWSSPAGAAGPAGGVGREMVSTLSQTGLRRENARVPSDVALRPAHSRLGSSSAGSPSTRSGPTTRPRGASGRYGWPPRAGMCRSGAPAAADRVSLDDLRLNDAARARR